MHVKKFTGATVLRISDRMVKDWRQENLLEGYNNHQNSPFRIQGKVSEMALNTTFKSQPIARYTISQH